jgi:signal transduction histidine kinase/CheY-like chemotaxis protein
VEIETVSGVYADIHLFSRDGTEYVLLLDATANVSYRRRVEEALRSTEEQLRHAEKMNAIGRLAGGIAHDFNNLLTVILGYHDVLAAQAVEDPHLQLAVQEIGRAAERAASLTGRLLAFSRKQLLSAVVLNVNTVVRDMRASLAKMIGEDVDLVISLDPDLGQAEVDRGQLEQVILNLAANARDAMPDGGRLLIETGNVREPSESDLKPFKDIVQRAASPVHADGDLALLQRSQEVGGGSDERSAGWVMISFTDTGCGMDQHTLEHAFEPFFTTKAGKGTGLGLASVQGVIAQSGGRVQVQSQPGRGTRFELYFPRVNKPLGEFSDAHPTRIRPKSSETILVVDDEALIRTLLERVLSQAGYNVLVAEDAEEAMRICRTQPGPIHLLLTDIVMPHVGGLELGRMVTAIRPEMRVLYMSGYAEDVIARRAPNDELTIRVLKKPFSADSLAGHIRDVLTEQPRHP